MLLTLSIAIMQVLTSSAIIHVLVFYCNYVGGTFCNTYVGGSFCCSYEGDCFCCNYAVRGFCNTYASKNFCIKYVGDSFTEIMQVESFLQSCRWYFLHCITHIAISLVIMQVATLINILPKLRYFVGRSYIQIG